jgi:hypothetical protein
MRDIWTLALPWICTFGIAWCWGRIWFTALRTGRWLVGGGRSHYFPSKYYTFGVYDRTANPFLYWHLMTSAALTFVVFLAASIMLTIGIFASLVRAQGFDRGEWLDKRNRGFYLAASVKSVALLVRTNRAEPVQVLLVDFGSGKRSRLKSEGSHLLSPWLSPDGERLLFSRQLEDHKGTELVSCDTGSLACHVVVRRSGSIHSAIEMSGNRLLYVSSPYYTRIDGSMRTNRNYIWVFDPATGPRQLTDFKAYQLGSLSVTQKHIYFSAYGSGTIPKQEPNADQQSSIFRLPFDAETARIELPRETMTPVLVSDGIATHPAASDDGSLVAYLRTEVHINPYHYNLVIADYKNWSQRLIESPGIGASRPVIIGHDVYASVVEEGRTLIQVHRHGEQSATTLAEIVDASIANIEAVELKIDP